MTNLSTLRTLLTSAHTAEALTQLAAWAQTQSPVWRQAAQLLQASWANNEQQANRGLIAYGEAERVRNRITHGALSLLDEIESGASAPKAVLDGLQKQFLTEQVAAVLQGGNMTTQNLLLIQKPYQEFSFPKITAKYFKFKILRSHGGSTWYPYGTELQLWGELN
jgi:hypothetical protein